MTSLAAVWSLALLLLAKVHAQLDADAGEKDAGDRRPLMRAHLQRKSESSAVHLTPSGDLFEVHAHKHGGREAPTDAIHSLCHLSFLLGKEDTNDCSIEGDHHIIDTMETCEFAAVQAGASAGPPGCPKGFDIGKDCDGSEKSDATGEDGLYNTHPIGCFKAKGKKVFYFNPWTSKTPDPATFPMHPGGHGHPERGGTPVCSRDRFLLGEAGTDDVCPDGGTKLHYHKEMNSTECRTAALCEFQVEEDWFQVGVQPEQPNADEKPPWMNEYDHKPSGCFYYADSPTDRGQGGGYVYFNIPQAGVIPAAIEQDTLPLCFLPQWSDDALTD